jgi:hypothetical protein
MKIAFQCIETQGSALTGSDIEPGRDGYFVDQGMEATAS